MKFSYNWMKELVSGLEAPPEQLSGLITMKTAESEGVERIGAHLAAVDTAIVLSAEPIEGSHNRKAEVFSQRYGNKTVVCGAPNCRPGLLTAYVPAGTTLPGGKEIRVTAIGGVVSDGMLASGAELGINDDHEGVLELAPGELDRCVPDAVIEIDNKSLTHRPDLWGHYGMAREVAAITGRQLIDPVKTEKIPQAPPPVHVEIENLDLAPRYSALVIENVAVGPSPLWLQQRLEAAGLNPISNVVDVTNFVMAELAQPMHAFDADRLHGDTIWARTAKPGERIRALNGETYDVGPSHLVIADSSGPVALAGVIGGMDSAIGGSTTRIVLESANFNPASIRKTSSALKLRTDASVRFEKAQDPENTVRALARAVEMLELVCPGIRVVGGLADCYRRPAPPAPIELSLEWLHRKLGRTVETAEVVRILESLQFTVEQVGPGVLMVRVPSWRATKDISIKDDLVEEVGRMIGYGAITPVPPLVPAVVPPANEERAFHHRVREMVAAQGFTEVYNYSFLSEEAVKELGFAPEDHVRVRNPIASDQTLMRRSLLPGILHNVRDNARHFTSFRLFEIGLEIHQRAEGLPEEIPHLAAAMYGKGSGEANLLELKRVAECLAPGIEVWPAQPRSFEHPARAAEAVWQGEALGRLFEFHPSLVEAGRAAVLDLDLPRLFEARRRRKTLYTPPRRYPASSFDLSVVTGLRDLAGEIERRLKDLTGPDLLSIEFVAKYSGPPLPANRKSISFRLTVGAPDRTLSAEDASGIRNRVIEGMRAAGYELRV